MEVRIRLESGEHPHFPSSRESTGPRHSRNISAKGLLVKLSSEKALQEAVSQAVGATWELPTHCRLLNANAILRAGLTPGPKKSQDIFSKSQQHIPIHRHIHIHIVKNRI